MVINPVVFDFGSGQIHLFTAAILLAAAIGIGCLLCAARRLGESPLRWLDSAVGLAIGGLIGGRAFHVLIEWDYFSVQRGQITDLSNGGFDWHGALIGGLILAALIGALRRIRWSAFTDALAVTLPIAAVAVWGACGQSACAVGQEVRTLADYPNWLVIESPDVYGQIAPRFNLPQIGVWFGIILFILIAIMTWRRLFTGQRLWVILILFSAGQAILDQFRGGTVSIWDGHRADQMLDSVAMIAALFEIIIRKRPKRNFAPSDTVQHLCPHPLRWRALRLRNVSQLGPFVCLDCPQHMHSSTTHRRCPFR